MLLELSVMLNCVCGMEKFHTKSKNPGVNLSIEFHSIIYSSVLGCGKVLKYRRLLSRQGVVDDNSSKLLNKAVN